MKWYPRYPGDFIRDTVHLSLAERGAYGALLDCYYAGDKPLPVDTRTLCRIANAHGEEEERAVRRVASEFFPVNGDGTRHNKRADKEIAKSKSKSKAAAARAATLSPEERRSIAQHAAQARWDRSR